jgi:hypothetical protein
MGREKKELNSPSLPLDTANSPKGSNGEVTST